MVDRMEFEELALKSIDLSNSPSLSQFSSNPTSEDKKPPFNVRTSSISSLIICVDTSMIPDLLGISSIIPFTFRGSFGATSVC